jgi:DNA-3-methyladenine glycosylase II
MKADSSEMRPDYWNEACRALARRDPVLKELVKVYPGIALRSRGDAFQTLSRAIVGQQISVKAADSVWQRFVETVERVEPKSVLRVRAPRLRSAGLSNRKVEYLRDLARHFHEGLIEERRWPAMSDDDIITDLVRVRGIGRWSAEMFLIFYLMRPDVLPLDDVGLQRAVARHYNDAEPLSRAEIQKIGASWRPWSTVATWYLWRSLEPIPVEY